MFDKKDLENIKNSINEYESNRDNLIKLSREIIRLSKKVIYSVHRNDLKSAKSEISTMNKKVSELNKIKDSKLKHSGSFKVAIQEYVEALCFYELVKNNSIPTNKTLKLDYEFYLMGLIDLTGELVRKAINSSINGDYKTSVKMKEVVSNLYDELMLFDFAGGELRKKFDSIKYDLKKLDDLVLNLKLSNKI